MKKIVGIIVALCAALVVVGCKSLPPASESMANARRNAPPNTLVGQGTGSDASKAEEAAKYQLTRAIVAIVKDMIDDSIASGKLEPSAAEEFRNGINAALRRVTLSSAIKQADGMGDKKVYWAVYYMEKADVVKVINLQVIGAKEAFPSAAAFTIEGLIDKAYASQAGKEWKS